MTLNEPSLLLELLAAPPSAGEGVLNWLFGSILAFIARCEAACLKGAAA